MTTTDSKTRPKISHDTREDHPPMYKVLLHNDDYTTMDFVVDILVRVFGKSLEKATQIIRITSYNVCYTKLLRASLEAVTSNSYQGKSFTDIFPSMRGFESLICTPFDAKALSGKVDVAFLALPHKVSMAFAPELIDRGIKVIDLSADFRFDDA